MPSCMLAVVKYLLVYCTCKFGLPCCMLLCPVCNQRQLFFSHDW